MSQSLENAAVVNALRQVVAQKYALIGQFDLCHWNVRGPGFFSLHTAFEGKFTEFFIAVDKAAERIRALGALAPGGGGNLAQMAGIEEIAKDGDANTVVKHVVNLRQKLVGTLEKARNLATEAEDSRPKISDCSDAGP